jgi:membrane protease YdiL (CAAX protease family)
MTEVFSVIMMFFPLFVIAWLANLAEARRQRGEPYGAFTALAYLILALVYAAGMLSGLALHAGSFFLEQTDAAVFEEAGIDFTFASLPLVGLGLWLPSLLGLLLLLPPVRRLVATFTRLDAENPVHAISLSLSMLVLINLLVTLGVGIGNFADIMASDENLDDNTMLTLWVQQILTALLAFVGVGWLTRRTWQESLARLALVIPSGREWLIAIGIGLGMVPVVLLLEVVGSSVGLGTDADVERLTEQLLGSLFTTPLGILTIGLSAGLGEETLFRGALQPRFGLILTAIFFALVHSQYGITLSTVVVLILGFLLGWLRLRYNTSTAMITHAVYNMTLGLLAYFGSSLLDV